MPLEAQRETKTVGSPDKSNSSPDVPKIESIENQGSRVNNKEEKLQKIRQELEESHPRSGYSRPRNTDSTGQIRVEYDGILSGKMTWHEDVFDSLTQAADLRTNVIIKKGHTDGLQTTELGSILAWKKLASPFDTFAQQERGRGYEVKLLLDSARAEIMIYDQQIQDEVRKEHEGKFDEEAFVRRVDDSTKQGLTTILNAEKWQQGRESGKEIAIFVVGTSLTLTGIGLGSGLIISGIGDVFLGALSSDLLEMGLGMIKTSVVGFPIFAGSVMGVKNILERINKIPTENPYKGSLADKYNPFKHGLAFLKGRLGVRGKTLVSLKKEID